MLLSSLFLTICLSGFAVAFLHAALPTHWLPFVLTARIQGWSRSKTLGVTALVGLVHVLFTSILGVLVAWLGIQVSEAAEGPFAWLAGGTLILIGLVHLSRQVLGIKHHCNTCSRCNPHLPAGSSLELTSDLVAIGGLIAILTFSPCEAFLPIYISGAGFGWGGFLMLSVILAAATLSSMLLFTFLTMAGMKKMNLKYFEEQESAIMGIIFCIFGLVVIM